MDLIDRYYGVDGRPIRRRNDQSGAGQAAGERDEVEYSNERLEDLPFANNASKAAQEHVKANIRHKAVKPARARSPFKLDQQGHDIFLGALSDVRRRGLIPDHPPHGVYSAVEELKVGKQVERISLPQAVWEPRSILWCQALDVMLRVIADRGL